MIHCKYLNQQIKILESANKILQINRDIRNLPVHMCVALPLLVQDAPSGVFMKLYEPTKEYKQIGKQS